MPADLRVWLLGGFRVEVAGQVVPDGAWQRSGATALVKLLALRGRLHRDEAVDLLWPEADQALGVRRWNKSLHFARRVLGSDRIELRDGMLALATAGLWTDVDAFDRAAQQGDGDTALELYTGDLLPQNAFDDWTEPRRAQLRTTVVPLLLDRSSRGDPRQAEADLVRLVTLDPLHEEAYARLMRLEIARGQRHLALRWYDRLTIHLHDDLGVEPRDDIQAMHRELTAPAAPSPGPVASPGTGLAEERKLVTVLDADLRGVREEDADADPERARREVAEWTELLREVVTRWGGAAQPLVGGGVIGVFGYPTAREDHADRALWAGSEILRRAPVPIRLGADTGQVITAPELARIGGAVLDAAARLRAAAAPRTLLVADRTRRAVLSPEFYFGDSAPAGDPPVNARQLLAAPALGPQPFLTPAAPPRPAPRQAAARQAPPQSRTTTHHATPPQPETQATADDAAPPTQAAAHQAPPQSRTTTHHATPPQPQTQATAGDAAPPTQAAAHQAPPSRTAAHPTTSPPAAPPPQSGLTPQSNPPPRGGPPPQGEPPPQDEPLQHRGDAHGAVARAATAPGRARPQPGFHDMAAQAATDVSPRRSPPTAPVEQPRSSVRPAPLSAAARWTVETPMIGRAGELRAVLGLIDEAVAGRRPRLITVTGVAGIGKTRLVQEVVARLEAGPPPSTTASTDRPSTTTSPDQSSTIASPNRPSTTTRPNRPSTTTKPDRPGAAHPPSDHAAGSNPRPGGVRVLRGRCLAAGDGITFWALGEILREACGIPLGDPDARAPQRLRSRLRRIFEGQRLSPAELDTTIFALATTAAIRLSDNPLDRADPRDVADELGRAWPRLASAFAARGPLLLIVEDLHWAGAPLVGMLSRLVTRSTGPVVLLTTARPEFLETRPDLPGVSMVSLQALTADDSRTLLSAHPRASHLPPAGRARILARAEGNPYFLDQLAAHVTGTERSPLPDSLHALLAARVDALPPGEKRLLQAAAVMGRVFWAAPLRDHLGADLPDLLAALENRALIRARPAALVTGQDEYAFQHALLRDVAYASLPVAQRAAGHAAVAAWLEEVSRERIGEVVELVAIHYAAAADGPDADDWTRGKAFRSLVTAGVGARRRYAVPRALDLHRAALRHAAHPAERAGALEAIGDDHETAYDGDEAVRAWREAITALRDAPGHGDRRAGLCLKTAQMLVARWGGFRVPADPALADRVLDEGLAAVTDPPTKAQLLSLRALCGGRWAWTGRTDPVPVTGRRRAATDAAALAERLGSPTLRGQALLGNAAVHFLEGNYEGAVTAVLDEVALVEQEGRDRDRALGHTIASLVVGAVRGDYERALFHAHRSYEWARGLSPHDRLHGTAAVLICLEQLGRDADVDPFLDEHLRLRQGPVATMACPYIRSGPLVGALALARRGDTAESTKVAATVEPDRAQPGNAEVLRARLALHRGDVSTARTQAERLVALGRRPGPEEIPHEALLLVQTLEAAGDHDALRRFLPRARAAAGYLARLTPACDRAEAAACDHGTRAG